MHTTNRFGLFFSLIITVFAASGCHPAPVQSAAEQSDKSQNTEPKQGNEAFVFADTSSQASDSALSQFLPIAQHFVDFEYDKGIIIAAVTPDGVSIKALGTLADSADPAHLRMPIGSMTKVFTGMQLASMVLDGTVSLDTPLAQCTPDGISAPGTEDITLKMLTTHTSGLPRLQPDLLRDPNINMNDPYTNVTPDAVWHSLETSPRNAVGTIQYSNYGEAVLGQALTQCAHADSWDSLLKTRVTGVLGLNSISIEADENMPQGYAQAMTPIAPWTWNEKGMAPAGALKSNILDLSRLLQMSMSDSDFPGREIIVKSQEILVAEDTPNAPYFAIGMNWLHGLSAYRGLVQSTDAADAMKNIIWHNGQTGSFNSYFGFNPQQKLGIVILSDTSTSHATSIGMLALAQAVGETGEAVKSTLDKQYPPAIALPAETLRSFEGDYAIDALGITIRIQLDEAGNLWDKTNQARLWPAAENAVRYHAINADIVFQVTADGISEATLTQDGHPFQLKKVQ